MAEAREATKSDYLKAIFKKRIIKRCRLHIRKYTFSYRPVVRMISGIHCLIVVSTALV